MKFEDLKKGEVLSEIQFYKVDEIKGDKVRLIADSGEAVVVDKNYVEQFLASGEQFESTIDVNKTQLQDIIINNPRTAMTVCYNKQTDVKELKKDLTKSLSKKLPLDDVYKVVMSHIEGEERIIKGRHDGHLDAGGRIKFIDMDIEKDLSKDYDTRFRLVDPRKLNYAIVNNVKYIVK